MKKLSILLLVALLSFSFVACGDDDEGVGVSFTAATDSKLLVNHQDNTDVVLFKKASNGTGPGVLLGGVPGLAQNHGVPGVTSTDGLFVLNVVTLADYKASPSDPRIATSILVYVDSVAATYAIASSTVGTGVIRFVNQGDGYVELRKESWYGSPLTVLRPYETKKLYLQPADYELFPVAKVQRQDGTGKIIGLVEKPMRNDYWAGSLYEGKDMDLTLSASGTIIEHAVAYITVVNQAERGVRLYTGSTLEKNALNREICNAGESAEYSFAGTVSGSVTKSLLAKDTMSYVTSTMGSSSYTFKNGCVYTVTLVAPNGTDGTAAGYTPGTITVVSNGTYDSVYAAK